MGQSGFSAAGGAGDEHLFPLADIQIDVVEGGFGLGGVVKAEILKGDDDIFFQKDPSYVQRQAAACPCGMVCVRSD